MGVNNVNTTSTNNVKKYEKATCPYCNGAGCKHCTNDTKLLEAKGLDGNGNGLKAVNVNGNAESAIRSEVAKIIQEGGKSVSWEDCKVMDIGKLTQVLQQKGYSVTTTVIGKTSFDPNKQVKQLEITDKNGNKVKIVDSNGDGAISVKEAGITENLAKFAKTLEASKLNSVDNVSEKIQAKSLEQNAAEKATKQGKVQLYQNKVSQLEEQLSNAKFRSFGRKGDVNSQKEVEQLRSQLRLAESELTIEKIRNN